MDSERSEVGVIVGRFQLHKLHTEHIKLIEYVLNRHKKVILFLGISSVIGTKRNPLDFTSRKLMIEEYFGNKLVILPLSDNSSDEVWSKQLDSKIREVFSNESITLYGSKDSFIPYYSGEFKCESLIPDNYVSATNIREECSKEILSSEAFRAGIIYSVYNTYSEEDVQSIEESKLDNVISEIEVLTKKSTYNVLEKFLKLNEELGEFSAAVIAQRGLTTKLYSKDNLVEEAADTTQVLLSIIAQLEIDGVITMKEVLDRIHIKNIKWEKLINRLKDK